MSTISQQMQATGVAPVIVVLNETPGAAARSKRDVAAQLEKHFTSSELSQSEAILEDGFVDALSPSRAGVDLPPPPPRGRRRHPVAGTTPMLYFKNLGIAYGVVDRAGLAALRADADVSEVTGAPQLRLIRPTKKGRAKTAGKVTWGIAALAIPELWRAGLTGRGVTVAHLDTGIDGKHPCFHNAIGAFVEFDRLGSQVASSTQPFDTDDHGTHTAATIAGRAVKNHSVGVAPGANLASALVIEGGSVIARVLGGMDWAVGQRARVLSMSLGFPGYVADFLPVTRILRDRGLLPIIASGNEGPGATRSPGNYTEALSVGWANEDRSVDPDSSSQRFRRRTQPFVPDLVAPGGKVVSAKPGGGFQFMSGTSMATPHVAGLAALLFEAEPTATLAQVETAIVASCERLPGVPPARQGRGLPNAPRALKHLQNR